jgi:Fasciclin domain
MKCSYKSFCLFSLSIMLTMLLGCSKMNDSKYDITNPALKQNLFELISANPDLSSFAKYLVQTGYDKVISSSKNYTVFAPANSSLATLDANIINNPTKLKLFIGNHIATQLYRTSDVSSSTRISMINGKYSNMLKTKLEDATIKSADNYASNGLLHIIDQYVPALDNCWEFINNNASAPAKQKAFMLSLFRNVFDLTNAVVIGIKPLTGEPIYQTGTDSIYTNLYWNKVHDLKQEQKQFTLFMLEDATWDSEITKFTPYFSTSTTDSNTLITSWNVVKDFAVDTLYNPTSIPDTIFSKFGTKLPVKKANIVKTIKTSNGIVYIMNKMDVQPASKFKTIVVEAENYAATSNDRRSNTYFRDRYNTLTGLDYKDVLVLNHGVALFNIRYDLPEIPSIKYKAYWVAVNDFQTLTFTQKLGIGSAASTVFPYTTVDLNNLNEIFIGEFAVPKYAPILNIYLVAANSTTATANPLVCDYIKLVPSL